MAKKAKKKSVKKIKPMKITKAIASKVLRVVDAGLSNGLGKTMPGQMCVEAAVAYAMGEPHGDNPKCVTDGIRDTKIIINDDIVWRNADPIDFSEDSEQANKARSKALRRLAIAQLGSKGVISNDQWENALKEYILNKDKELTKEVKIKVASLTKKLEQALKDLKERKSFDVSLEFTDPFENIDTTDLMDNIETIPQAKKVCEDLVQILIKLKSPGTKFLYLTEK